MARMDGSLTGVAGLDPLLAPYATAPETEAQALLLRLLREEIEPVVDRVLASWRGRSGKPELADLRSETLLQLLRRLRALRENPTGRPISDLHGYAATVALNVCRERLLRQRRPERDLEDRLERLPDGRSDAVTELMWRDALTVLWSEILALPPKQAAALLLGLRDTEGRSALILLPATGTASLRQIAAALGWSAEDLAEVWNHLPLPDRQIAEMLGLTRQQVINLRKSARERLARRMEKRGIAW